MRTRIHKVDAGLYLWYNQRTSPKTSYKTGSIIWEGKTEQVIAEKGENMAENNRIKRINEMEASMERVNKAVTIIREQMERLNSLSSDIEKLQDYYENEWREDFEADERGELPKDLKRGVLSEDALFDLLEETERYMDCM